MTGHIERSGIVYDFVSPGRIGRPLTRSAGFRDLVTAANPDVVHIHGLGFSQEVVELHQLLPNVPILLQDHADRPPRLWRRRRWRQACAAAAGISFCARDQAEPFKRLGVLGPTTMIFELPESTSTFEPGEQSVAREQTGIYGDPAVLSVGHLNANKDPLTVLDGIAATIPDLPNLQLWMCYGSVYLLSAVRTRIEADPNLRDRVHLLGRVPHGEVERLMRAADVFVLGSHREGGSFSLIEALATGLTPVATDIPSTRSLTGYGKVGMLWNCGDAHDLRRALIESSAALDAAERNRVRSYFVDQLSEKALGRRFREVYTRLAELDRAAEGQL